MTPETFNAIVDLATEMWRAKYPNRSGVTPTACRQIGALLPEARRVYLARAS